MKPRPAAALIPRALTVQIRRALNVDLSADEAHLFVEHADVQGMAWLQRVRELGVARRLASIGERP